MKVAINGIGALGGFGYGMAALEESLNGKSPAGQWVDFDTTRGAVHVPGLMADTAPLADYIPKRALRRINHNNRVALLAAFSALADADLFDANKRGRLGIMVATGYGATCNNFDFQHLSSDGADFSGSPTKFSNSVHNAAAAYISIALKEHGPNHSISHLDMSFPSALITAIQWLHEDRVDAVLVGGTDEFCKALAYEWYCCHMPPDQPPPQLPLNHVPPMVGEGACFFVLSRAGKRASSYAVIDQAALERRATGSAVPSGASAYIVSTDRSKEQIQALDQMLPPNAALAAYPHIYGMMPVGSAFDLAIAALSLKQNKLFAPQTLADLTHEKCAVVSPAVPLSEGPICCLQLGAGNTLGWVTLDRA